MTVSVHIENNNKNAFNILHTVLAFSSLFFL